MRILAGAYKGRKLLAPPRNSPARPMTGLAKKSLFEMLGGQLSEATIVDLYCGTGTLGLEALSRGARRCYFADRDRAVLLRLRRNIRALEAEEQCRIWPGDAPARLRRRLDEVDGCVDVAFVDPPFAAARQRDWNRKAGRIFAALAEKLAGDGLVVLRLPGRVEPPERIAALTIRTTRRYGDMTITIFAHTPDDGT